MQKSTDFQVFTLGVVCVLEPSETNEQMPGGFVMLLRVPPAHASFVSHTLDSVTKGFCLIYFSCCMPFTLLLSQDEFWGL